MNNIDENKLREIINDFARELMELLRDNLPEEAPAPSESVDGKLSSRTLPDRDWETR